MILLNKRFVAPREEEYVIDAVRSQKISGDGVYSGKCSRLIMEKFGAKNALLTPSCTASLELAALAIDIKEGDEIIMPSYTFVSTANAFVLRGAKPIFVDIREDTLNIDESKIEEKITPKTKAIVPVHYGGVSVEMKKIMEIAERHNLRVIEDAAQGVDALYDGKYLGTIGDIGCYSFHDTKNVSCGEGGAILINNSELMEIVEISREKGTNRSKFFRGEVDKYSWVSLGSSYLMSDIAAAALYAQLKSAEEITKRREEVYKNYVENLKDLEDIVRFQSIPSNCSSNYHLFYMIGRSAEETNNFFQYLRERDIFSTFHYVPLHTCEMGKKFGYNEGDLPITESVSLRLARIPINPMLTESEQELIIDTIHKFYNRSSGRKNESSEKKSLFNFN